MSLNRQHHPWTVKLRGIYRNHWQRSVRTARHWSSRTDCPPSCTHIKLSSCKTARLWNRERKFIHKNLFLRIISLQIVGNGEILDRFKPVEQEIDFFFQGISKGVALFCIFSWNMQAWATAECGRNVRRHVAHAENYYREQHCHDEQHFPHQVSVTGTLHCLGSLCHSAHV